MRLAALGDIHLAHDLEARNDRGLNLFGRRSHFLEHAVDTEPHADMILVWLNVNVGGLVGDRLTEQQVHILHQRSVGGVLDGRQHVDGRLLVHDVFHQAAKLGLRAVEHVDARVDLILDGARELDVLLGDGLQVVLNLPIHRRLRVSDHDQIVAFEANRDDSEPTGLVTRDHPDRFLIHGRVHDLDELHAGGLYGVTDDVAAGDRSLLDQYGQNGLAANIDELLSLEELFLGDHTLTDEDVGDGLTHAAPSAAARKPALRRARCRSDTRGTTSSASRAVISPASTSRTASCWKVRIP